MDVPTTVSQLQRLTRLEVCNVRSLPESIGEVQQLRVLLLTGLHLTDLPSSIGLLRNLEELYLAGGNLQSFPTSMKFLVNLQVLQLSSMKMVADIPVMIEHDKLSMLSVDSMPALRQLPRGIGRLGNLRHLHLDLEASTTIIIDAPVVVISLESLFVSFGSNVNRRSPRALPLFPWGRMRRLKKLCICGVADEALPSEVAMLVSLEHLVLRSCPALVSVPMCADFQKHLVDVEISDTPVESVFLVSMARRRMF